MFELFVAPLAWVLQKAADVFVGRVAEKGADRVVDRLDDRWRRKTVAVPEPTRHRLGEVTSDVDIVVKHVPPSTQRVLLTFQATPLAGERTSGVIVPMLLSEAAHLTLPRGDYLIGALVLDPPAYAGGKPVLRGIGGIQHWIASNRTNRLTIETTAPTTDLLKQLGLLPSDGTSPFELPVPEVPPQPLPTLSDLRASLTALTEETARFRAELAQANAIRQAPAPQCRAAINKPGLRCLLRPDPADTHGLCILHSVALKAGKPVYDWASGKPIT